MDLGGCAPTRVELVVSGLLSAISGACFVLPGLELGGRLADDGGAWSCGNEVSHRDMSLRASCIAHGVSTKPFHTMSDTWRRHT
jgi:hypothetical protein